MSDNKTIDKPLHGDRQIVQPLAVARGLRNQRRILLRNLLHRSQSLVYLGYPLRLFRRHTRDIRNILLHTGGIVRCRFQRGSRRRDPLNALTNFNHILRNQLADLVSFFGATL